MSQAAGKKFLTKKPECSTRTVIEHIHGNRVARELGKFVKTFSEGGHDPGSNVCAIGQLGPLLSEKVIRQWLDKKGRALTNYQVKKSMVHDLPIHIKMLSYCVLLLVETRTECS